MSPNRAADPLASEAGWILRDVIIWRKDRTRPWSNRGRLRNGFEYVLFLVKSNEYKYHVDRLRDTGGLKSWWVKYPERHNPWGMTPDNVWEIPIPVQGSWATPDLRHACPFPDELVRRIISLSTDEGDVVFDPFAGSGMVAGVTESEGRVPLGTELNGAFIEAYIESVRPSLLEVLPATSTSSSENMTERLLALRVLKYPKDLLKQLLRTGVKRDSIRAIVVTADPFDVEPRASSYAVMKCELLLSDSVSDTELRTFQRLVLAAESKAPLSKYTVEVSTTVKRISKFGAKVDQEYAIYRRGRTWRFGSLATGSNLSGAIDTTAGDDLPPVISPIVLNQGLEGE